MSLCLKVRMQIIFFFVAKYMALWRVVSVCVCVRASIACESLGIAFAAFQRRALIAWLLTSADLCIRITASAATIIKQQQERNKKKEKKQQSQQRNKRTLGCACQWFVQRIATNKSKQHTYLQHKQVHTCKRMRTQKRKEKCMKTNLETHTTMWQCTFVCFSPQRYAILCGMQHTLFACAIYLPC